MRVTTTSPPPAAIAFGDGDDLRASLALGEDDFGNSLAKRAMMVDLGEAEVLVGKPPQELERRGNRAPAAADVVEQLRKPLLIQG